MGTCFLSLEMGLANELQTHCGSHSEHDGSRIEGNWSLARLGSSANVLYEITQSEKCIPNIINCQCLRIFFLSLYISHLGALHSVRGVSGVGHRPQDLANSAPAHGDERPGLLAGRAGQAVRSNVNIRHGLEISSHSFSNDNIAPGLKSIFLKIMRLCRGL